jgi:hypothetical protein
MKTALIMAALLLASPISVLAQTADDAVTTVPSDHPEARVFDASANAQGDVYAALARAQARGKNTIIVMGANWCHDSIGLAGWFATPRFAAMMEPKYEIVYVDVGVPQSGQGRNLDIAKRWKAKKIKGTPTVLIVSAQGTLLNKNDAGTWRNAASRSEDDIFRYFEAL